MIGSPRILRSFMKILKISLKLFTEYNNRDMRIIKTVTNVRNLKTRPWISKKTKRAIKRKNRFIKRRRTTKNSTDYHIYRRIIRNTVNGIRSMIEFINYVTSKVSDNTNQNPNRLIWNLI